MPDWNNGYLGASILVWFYAFRGDPIYSWYKGYVGASKLTDIMAIYDPPYLIRIMGI
jgi:hypothetical protein